ncbi:MAG TPA: hypothetical protein DEO59_01995 [Balneola sp.]|nr:hypothetical protein [Balneola sp.]
MNIGVVLDYERDWPPGIRAEKQSIAFAEAGHEVFVFTPKYKKELPDSEFNEELQSTIWRASVDKTQSSYLKTAIRALTIYDGRYLEPIKEFIKANDIQVLHVHDIWLIPVSQNAAKEFDIPVVADLHENMPAAMVAARSEMSLFKKIIHGFFWNYRLMRWHERRMLKKCIHNFVVAEEATDRLIEYGTDSDKISVVSNTEDETTFDFKSDTADPMIVERYTNNFMCSYVGTIGAHRGLDTVLKAISECTESIPNLKLVIVGADATSKEKIRSEIERYNISDWVELYGWLPFEKVQSYIKASDVCLVPHNDFEHTQTTIPHKLFQYMICSKPVLVSDCKPLKRVVSDSNCGLIFQASNHSSFANKLIEMYVNRSKLNEFGENGRASALGKYAWRNDAKVLKEVYSKIQENTIN